MSRIIARQPNGKYLVYGTIVDDVLLCNYDKEMLYKHYKRLAVKEAERQLNEIFEFDNLDENFKKVVENLKIHNPKSKMLKIIKEK